MVMCARVAVLLFLGVVAYAQDVCVRVLDPGNEPLQSAKVSAVEVNGKKSLAATSRSVYREGRFCFAVKNGDVVQIRVAEKGFVTTTLEDLRVKWNEHGVQKPFEYYRILDVKLFLQPADYYITVP